MVAGVEAYMATTEYEARMNLFRNVFRQSKDGWTSRTDLLRQIRSISARDRDDIIRNLKEAGLISEEIRRGGGRPSLGWRWSE